jgi:hypothetical protein
LTKSTHACARTIVLPLQLGVASKDFIAAGVTMFWKSRRFMRSFWVICFGVELRTCVLSVEWITWTLDGDGVGWLAEVLANARKAAA